MPSAPVATLRHPDSSDARCEARTDAAPRPMMRGGTPIVHIVETDERVREATALMLIRRHWAVRAFASGAAFLDGIGADPVGCLVLGTCGAGDDDRDPKAELSARHSDLPIVHLDSRDNPKRTVVTGYRDAEQLTDQPWYRDVLERRVRDATEWHAERRSTHRHAAANGSRQETLTSREQEILKLLEAGLSSKRIGRELDISHRTVDVHRANVMRKLGVGSLSELRGRRSAKPAPARPVAPNADLDHDRIRSAS